MTVRLLIGFALAAAVSVCWADTGPSSKSNASAAHPKQPPSEPSQGSGGDPVGYIDGNVYESVVDLRVPCPDIDLVFRRAYGSWSMDAGTLGYGWTHGYEWSLSVSSGSDRVVVRSAGEGIDNLLAVKVGGNVYYPLSDIHGTVWGYVDSQNSVVARWTYDAWGNVLSEFCIIPALASVRYRFQGREWSATTGLINFRMRWYDANVGRWLSKDSAGLKGGINLFVLCRNDPVNFSPGAHLHLLHLTDVGALWVVVI